MFEPSGRAEAGVVHKSAHPSLPPAVPQQVVQYLLAKNFHLTALELLVEAQQAGHGDDVRDLEAFFSDPDRFPPEELARHQPDNAFDLQATGREREARLQLAEYELRLAKEDLAEMARKLKAQVQERQQAQERQQQAPGAGVSTGESSMSPFASGSLPAAASPSPSSDPLLAGTPTPPPPPIGTVTTGSNGNPPHSAHPALSASPSATGAAPTAAEQQVLNAAVFLHLVRLGLVTTAMTMEEEYGRPLRPVGQHGGPSSSTSSATHGTDAEQWELWSWYQAAAARETASAAAAAAAAATAGSAAGEGLSSVAGDGGPLAGSHDLISQFDLGPDLDLGARPEDLDEAAASLPPEELRAQLLATRRELALTRSRAKAALAAAQQQLLRSPTPPPPHPTPPPLQQQQPYLASDANVLDLLDLGSSHGAAAAAAAAAAATPHSDGTAPPGAAAAQEDSNSSGAAAGAAAPSAATNQPSASEAGPAAAFPSGIAASRTDAEAHAHALAGQSPWLQDIDSAYHVSLEALVTRLCELLPRLVPNLTIKSRLDVLPLIVDAAKTITDWTVRRQLLASVFNLAPAPDHQQRQAIIDACLELCRSFGSGWAATELVELCCRQASSPSSERRTLVAEALGAAVGVVDAGTQAHVLLTQLSQLAKDRLEQVREAACHSLARLVPRLPFSRSYYTPLEALLLPLATDSSETVHSAALSYLVPALLTWQPQDNDSVLVSSCLARVVSEVSQQVRVLEQHQNQRAAAPPPAAAAAADAAAVGSSGSSASSFGGTFLRYSLSGSGQGPAPPPPHPAATSTTIPASEGPAGAAASIAAPGSGSGLSDPAPAPPPSPLPPQQPVHFGRRTFPSASHLLLYQLLALYGGLAPALRHAALRSRPPWATHGTSDAAAGGSYPPPAAATASPACRHKRTSSFGAPDGSATTTTTTTTSTTTAGGSSPSHRRTSSHPVLAAAAAEGQGGGGGGGNGQPRHTQSSLALLRDLPPMPVEVGGPRNEEAVGDRRDEPGAGILGGNGGSGGGGEDGDTVPPSSLRRPRPHGEEAAEWDAEADSERAEADALLSSWASHPAHNSWKTLEWVMQHVMPELLRLVCGVGPTVPDAIEVRRQAANAVAATCGSLGAPFTRAAVVPLFLVASGSGATVAAAAGSGNGAAAVAEYDVPLAVRDLCASVQPRSNEALRTARQCALPVLLAAVLPAARQLRPYLEHLLGSAHELRHRWLLAALPDYTAALTFACSHRPDLVPEVLRIFEDLLSGSSQVQPESASHDSRLGDGAQTPVDADGATQATPAAAAAGPASTAVGLGCAALAKSLVPLASLEMASRRLLPGLMALMSYGEPELQRACVGVLAELGLRFRGDGPRVSEQVLAVYDSLLEQGAHGVQLEVLAAGTALAAAAAPSAAVSAAAAAQVEWLLMAVQVVAARLVAPAAAGAAAPTQEQQRAVAAQLLAGLRAVAPYNLRLPRLQANLGSALDALQRCKALLPDAQQQAALVALLKERPTGQSTAGASVSSSSLATTGTAVAPLRTGPQPPSSPSPAMSMHTAAGAAAAAAVAAGTTTPTQAGGMSHYFMQQQTPGSGVSGSAAGTPDGAGVQLRSRFDAFKQRLLKRREDAAPTAQQPGGGGAGVGGGGRPKETFFSDDEGE